MWFPYIEFIKLLYTKQINYSGNPNRFIPTWSGEPNNPMTLYIVKAAWQEQNLLPGDEIGIFDDDNCVGVGLVTQPISNSSPLKIVADYFTNGPITFKFWKSDIWTEIDEVEGKIGDSGTDALRKQLSNQLDLLDKQKKELEELSRLKEIEQEKQEQS